MQPLDCAEAGLLAPWPLCLRSPSRLPYQDALFSVWLRLSESLFLQRLHPDQRSPDEHFLCVLSLREDVLIAILQVRKYDSAGCKGQLVK